MSTGENEARKKARARAAILLKISPSAIEDDLLEFLTATNGDALLRARAGSGKTTAIAIKVAYLINDLGVKPSTVMVLAFNNAAARSIETRLSEFGVLEGVRVRTFHALSQRIVRAHFGGARRGVFDEDSEDGKAIAQILQDAIDETVNQKFYYFCAGRMRTNYSKRQEYVESIGRDALISAVGFLRARGYGLMNRMQDAWEEGGPIAGTAMKVAMAYEVKLREARLLDATSVLQAAAWTLEKEIESGLIKPSDAHEVDWIFIDEFQDVSLPYMRLVSAVRRINVMANVQGVGDDWQAINGFAGADLEYFTNAEEHLENPELLDLLRNRRSGSDIVSWGNNVMVGAGHPDAPAIPHNGNGQGEINRAKISSSRDLRVSAQRLAKLVDPKMDSVALIARKWKVGNHTLHKFRDLVQHYLKESGYKIRVTGITAHGSKGLEYDQVLLLDDGSFPLEHPSRPILEGLIPEAHYLREEACLKHVAGTRARKRLDIVDMT
jgi:DNA helicase-4